jgi:hypothetical protein
MKKARDVRPGPRRSTVVSDGRIGGATLTAALASLSLEIDRVDERGHQPVNHPYRLIVYKGGPVVAVRPATLGIC